MEKRPNKQTNKQTQSVFSAVNTAQREVWLWYVSLLQCMYVYEWVIIIVSACPFVCRLLHIFYIYNTYSHLCVSVALVCVCVCVCAEWRNWKCDLRACTSFSMTGPTTEVKIQFVCGPLVPLSNTTQALYFQKSLTIFYYTVLCLCQLPIYMGIFLTICYWTFFHLFCTHRGF